MNIIWTREELAILKENYNKVSNDELAKLLPQKSRLAIYKKGYSLGYRKTAESTFINRSNARKGDKCCAWKGGVKKGGKGYRLVLCPEHYRADKNGYVLEHILEFEKATGVVVPKECCIHHLNGNKEDNRLENLCMMLTSAHTTYHNRKRGNKNE